MSSVGQTSPSLRAGDTNSYVSVSVSLPEDEGPITYEDVGVPRPKREVTTKFGKRRHLSNLSRGEMVFGIVSLLSILGSAGLTIERLVTAERGSPDVTFASVVLLTTIFCMLYVVNGIVKESPFELFIFIVCTLTLFIYSATNFGLTMTTGYEYTIKLVRLILITVFGLINIVAAFYYARVYQRSKNFIFRIVGAQVSLQNLCYWVFLTESLFKLDFQMELTLVILILRKGFVYIDTLETIVLILGIVYAVTWLVMGFYAISREQKILVYILLATSWCQPAYIIYSFVRVGRFWNAGDFYRLVLSAIVVAGLLGLLVRIVLCAFLLHIYRNFGKGMKEKVYGHVQTEGRQAGINDDPQTEPVVSPKE